MTKKHCCWLEKSFRRLNDTPQAISFYRKIIELNPFHEKAYEQLASLFANESQWEKAIEVLDEAIDINATSNLYQLRGRLKLEKGDKDGSLEDMKKALELSPEKENAINGHFDNQSHPDSRQPDTVAFIRKNLGQEKKKSVRKRCILKIKHYFCPQITNKTKKCKT